MNITSAAANDWHFQPQMQSHQSHCFCKTAQKVPLDSLILFVYFKKTRVALSQVESLRLLSGEVSKDSRVRQARDSSQELEA